MAQPKTLFATTLIAALGGALTSHYLFHPSTERLATTSVNTSSYQNQGETAELKQTIEQLQQENGRLKNLLENHPSKNTPIEKIASQAATTPDEAQVQLQQQIQQLEMEKHLRNANEFGNRIMQAQHNNPHFNLNEVLARGFNNEQRDPQWADEQERTYRNLFTDTTELADFALRDSQCKSRQCELTVSINSLEQSDLLLEKINKTLAASNKNAVVVIAPDTQAGTSKLYISKDATSFEFN